ncbi:hypothetical protein VTI28DRAFT_2757 [Corynascus sepedonium]
MLGRVGDHPDAEGRSVMAEVQNQGTTRIDVKNILLQYAMSPWFNTLYPVDKHGTAGSPLLLEERRVPTIVTRAEDGGKMGNLHAAVSAWDSGIRSKHFLPLS